MLQARQEELHKQEQDMQDKLRTKVRVSRGSICSSSRSAYLIKCGLSKNSFYPAIDYAVSLH